MARKILTKAPSPKSPAVGPILCGVDFSPHSIEAAEIAAGIAARLKRPLILTHALDFPELGSAREIANELARDRKQQARKLARSLKHWGAPVEAEVLPGRPGEVLFEEALDRKGQLVVVASMSRPAVSRWFLGSVAERTAERSAAPTLVIRDASPFLEWLRGKRTLKVVVSFSFSADAFAAARWARELAALGKCELVVAHVDWPFEEHARIGGATPSITGGNPPDVQRVLERDVRIRAGQIFHGIPFRVRVEPAWGRTGGRIAEIVREEGADLVVAGSHQYRGLGRWWHTSVSREILHDAQCSVAVVPMAAAAPPENLAPSPIRRVLACTDFSEMGNRAARQAYTLLGSAGTVYLLHVRPGAGRPPFIVNSRELVRSAQGRELASLMKKLHALTPLDGANRGIFSQVLVAENDNPAAGICQAAEQLGVDAICLASHGRSGLGRALLGSVAEEVMRKTSRMVVIVKDSGE